jgi:hypothetical protein
MNPLTVLQRAFSGNLQTIGVSPAEQSALAAGGIGDPTLQRYLVWRKATLVMVIVATLISAGFGTYDWLNADDDADEADLIAGVVDTGVAKIEEVLPQAKEAIEAARAFAAKKQAAAEKADEKEAAEAEKTGEKEEAEKKTPGEIVDEITHQISLWLLPVAALVALLLGHRLGLSFRVLAIAFVVSFILPMIIAILPNSWWGGGEDAAAGGNLFLEFIDEVKDVFNNTTSVLLILPSVLSLIPGTQKACLRIKTLLPQSLLSGWLVVVASALYGLFLLVIWVLVEQVTPEPLVLLGFFLVTASSFVIPFRASTFTRPFTSDADFKRMKAVQLIVTLMMATGGILLLVYVVREEFFGYHIFGASHEKGAVMDPFDLVRFLVEIISKSMFVTAVGADLILRMNLKAWQENRGLQGTPAATDYDSAMAAVQTRFDATPAA